MLFRVHTLIPTWHEDTWRSRDFNSTIWLEEGTIVCKLYTIDFDEELPTNANDVEVELNVYFTQYGLCVISQLAIKSYAESIEVL